MTYPDLVFVLLGAAVLLALVGTLREVAFLRVEVSRVAGAPSALAPGQPLPADLAVPLEGRLATTAGDVHHLVLLNAECRSCARYARRLAEAAAQGHLNPRDVTVLGSGAGAAGLAQLLRSAGVMAVEDPHVSNGAVRATAPSKGGPITVTIDASSGIVREVSTAEAPLAVLNGPGRRR